MDQIEKQRKRLRIRAWRRGTKEADLILGRYANLMLPTMEVTELSLFESLLEEPDVAIYDWICGRAHPPVQYQELIVKIQEKL